MNYCFHHLNLPILNVEFLRNVLLKSVDAMTKHGLKSPILLTKDRIAYHPLDLNIRALNITEIDNPEIHRYYE
jgi:hypothetical protein